MQIFRDLWRSAAIARSVGLTVLLLACSPSTADPAPDTTSGVSASSTSTPFPCEIGAVLQSKCWSCHGAQTLYGAPMSLTTWESTRGPTRDGAEPIFQRIGERVGNHTMPPPQMPQLTEQEAALLESWVAQGGPTGSGCQPPPVGQGGGASQGGAPAVGGGGNETGSGGVYYGSGGAGSGDATGAGGGPDPERRSPKPARTSAGRKTTSSRPSTATPPAAIR